MSFLFLWIRRSLTQNWKMELSTWRGLQRMELITGEDGCCSTISSQPFLLYHQVGGADYMAMVAALLYHLFSTIPPLPSG